MHGTDIPRSSATLIPYPNMSLTPGHTLDLDLLIQNTCACIKECHHTQDLVELADGEA
jgi:hypothetical protein